MAFEAVRAGNRQIAYQIISNLVKFPNWGFNNLHAQVLSKDEKLEKVHRASCQKKANTNKDLTPIHCACINPNPYYLKTLLDLNPEHSIVDAELRRPVHYAAACEGPEPLRVLIQAGATLHDVDN